MLILSVLFNFVSSYLIASIAGSLLVIYAAFFALIILNMEILSLFNQITGVNILIFSFVNLILSFVFYKKFKCPILKPAFDIKRFKNALLLDKSLILLFFAFLILIAVSFFLSYVMPPLEPDSQTYHFIRAFEFVKNGNINHFDTNDIRALVMPINSEIVYAWILALKKNFFGYGLVSFFSYIAALGGLYSILDYFKFSKRKILWVIFLVSSLPAVIIQISSLQTDIIIGALLLNTVALFLKESKIATYFSSLCLAIAFGTKSTGVMALFSVMLIFFGIEFFVNKNKKFEKIKLFILLLVINFLVFSSYNYILNFIQFHNPLSNRAAYLGHKFWGGIQGFIANVIRFFFQAFDFTGFKWGFYLNDKILEFQNNVFNFIHIDSNLGCNVALEKVNISTDEQVIGFGILGFLIYLPCVFYSIAKTVFKKSKRTIIISLFGLAFLLNILVLSSSIGYMVFSIRFIVAFCLLSSVCLVVSYAKKGFIKPVIIFFMLFYMILLPMHIKRMPFWGIVHNLKINKYNIELFVKDCFENKVISVLGLSKNIYETIEEKYFNFKKIGLIKSSDTAMLYLKTLKDYEFDFLTASRLDEYDLNKYDLIIVENTMQDDNVFNPEDVKTDYKIENNNVIFNKTDKVKCYFAANRNIAEDSIKRWCLGYDYMINNKTFKKDYCKNFKTKDTQTEFNICYFIKR